MSDTHTYDFTYETTQLGTDTIIGSWEVRVEYALAPGRPAVMYLKNGDPGYPEEAPEIEITGVFVEEWKGDEDFPMAYQYRPAVQTDKMGEFDEYGTFYDYALDERFDDMIEAAFEDRKASEEDAKEHAAEVRADIRRMNDG